MTYPDHRVETAITERFVPLRLHLFNDRHQTREFQVFWTPTILIGDRSGRIRYTSINYLPPDEFLDILDIGEAMVTMRWRGYEEAIELLSEVEARRPDGPLTAEAMYWRGTAAYFRDGRNMATAHAIWDEIGERLPNSIWAKRNPGSR